VESNAGTKLKPQTKAAYRREEKRLLLELASAATSLAQPKLDYAQLYIGRLLLARALADLVKHTEGEL
jgi:hypothetical protein